MGPFLMEDIMLQEIIRWGLATVPVCVFTTVVLAWHDNMVAQKKIRALLQQMADNEAIYKLRIISLLDKVEQRLKDD